MNILFLGDVVGGNSRRYICQNLSEIKRQFNIDFCIVNVDNASGGFGIAPNCAKDFLQSGADVLTGGDHIWDQREANIFLNQDRRLLRPHNFPKSAPGSGFREFLGAGDKKYLVIHLMGQVFMKYNVNCPFECAEEILKNYRLGQNIDAIFVDFHAEATSEKMAMAKFLDGKISAIIGSHTHIPTNDCHIMRFGSAYQSDAGMCGDYDSVIGMDKNTPIQTFLHKRKMDKMEPAKGEVTICGAVIEVENKTGLASKIFPIKIGGVLASNN